MVAIFHFLLPHVKRIKHRCWLTAVSKPQVHNLSLPFFEITFFVIHCCPQVPLLTLACLWLYIPHTYGLTNKLLSVTGFLANYSSFCWKGRMYLRLPFFLLQSFQQSFCTFCGLVRIQFSKKSNI